MPQGVSKDSEEYKAYLKDKQKVKDFLTKFDYKDNFRKVVIQLLKKEVYYVWFRKTKWNNQGMKYALQTLPPRPLYVDRILGKRFAFVLLIL